MNGFCDILLKVIRLLFVEQAIKKQKSTVFNKKTVLFLPKVN